MPRQPALPDEVPVVAWDHNRGVYVIHSEMAANPPPMAPPAPVVDLLPPPLFEIALSPEAEATRRRYQALKRRAANYTSARENWMRRLFGAWA